MKASNWKSLEKGTLRGFFDLLLDSGLQIYGMSLHEKGTARWVSFPSRPYKDDSDETKYQPLLKIPDKTRRKKFQNLAKAAVALILNGQAAQEGSDVPW
jgi:hypothetical protein